MSTPPKRTEAKMISSILMDVVVSPVERVNAGAWIAIAVIVIVLVICVILLIIRARKRSSK